MGCQTTLFESSSEIYARRTMPAFSIRRMSENRMLSWGLWSLHRSSHASQKMIVHDEGYDENDYTKLHASWLLGMWRTAGDAAEPSATATGYCFEACPLIWGHLKMMANDFLYIWIFQSILILCFILSIIVCEYLSGWGCLEGTMSDRSETRILHTEMACIYAPHKSHIDNQNAWVSTNCHQPLASNNALRTQSCLSMHNSIIISTTSITS